MTDAEREEIRREVAAWPPMSDEQVEQVVTLLRPAEGVAA